MMINIILAALLYPTVIKTGDNLFADSKWKSRSDGGSAHAWSKGVGGPFSSQENNWRVESNEPESSFWRQDVKLQAGHRYLVGMWFKSENARAILWCWSRTQSGKPFNERMYLYGGFNACLKNFIRSEIQAKLGSGADKWNLLYRPLEIKEELAIPVQFKFGIYMSTGALVIAHPFLIDITDSKDISLTAEVEPSRAVSQMSLVHVGERDTIWNRDYASVSGVNETLTDGVDMLRGFAQNKVDGHMLVVKYTDGTIEHVSSPQENAFQTR